MVAAWIRALTGVGPSMASGSHTCSGNCALLPTAPTNTRITAVVNSEPPINPDWAASEMSEKATEPFVALHKGAGVELDHEAHEADHHQHHRGQAVDVDAHGERAAGTQVDPVHGELYGGPAAGHDAGHEQQGEHGEDQRDRHPENGHVLGVLLEQAPKQGQHEENQRRKRRYGRDYQLLAYGLHGPPSSLSSRLLRPRSRSAASGTRRAL